MTDATPLLVAGLKDTFDQTYGGIQNRQADSRLSMVMDLNGNPSEGREENYGFWESAPHLDRWVRGAAIPAEPMFGKTFNVINHNWAKAIEWHRDDRADDRTRSLLQQASRLAEDAGNLDERVFFEFVTGSYTLLPGTPVAPDGSAMWAASRFGTSDGNTVATDGIGSSLAVTTNYFEVMDRFRQFQDTKGQPLWRPDIIDQGVVIIYASDNDYVFQQAFTQERGISTHATTQTSNIVQDANRNVTLWPTSRITSDEWYVFLKGAPVKAAFAQERQAMEFNSSLQGQNNGDTLRRFGTEFVSWDMRRGYSMNTVYGACAVQ